METKKWEKTIFFIIRLPDAFPGQDQDPSDETIAVSIQLSAMEEGDAKGENFVLWSLVVLFTIMNLHLSF